MWSLGVKHGVLWVWHRCWLYLWITSLHLHERTLYGYWSWLSQLNTTIPEHETQHWKATHKPLCQIVGCFCLGFKPRPERVTLLPWSYSCWIPVRSCSVIVVFSRLSRDLTTFMTGCTRTVQLGPPPPYLHDQATELISKLLHGPFALST